MITSAVDDQKQLTTHTCSGCITAEELLSTIDSIYAGDPTPDHLWDFLGADVSNLSTDQVDKLAEFTRSRVTDQTGGMVALVTSSIVGLGLARAFQTYADEQGLRVQMKVFRSLEAAGKWLGTIPTATLIEKTED